MKGLEAMDLIEDKYLDEVLRGKYRRTSPFVRWGIFLAAAAAVFMLVFIGSVNLFPATAYAMSRIGVLGDLVRSVTFDKSMRVCLENEYAQYVGEKKTTKDGWVSEVYCMVVDASRISVFFQTDVPNRGQSVAIGEEEQKEVVFDIEDCEGLEEYEYCSMVVNTNVKNLYEYRLDFVDKKIPEKMNFRIDYYRVNKDGGETLASYSTYTLYPDMKYTKVVKTYEVNQTFEVEGQKIMIESLEVYPTQAKLLLRSDKENTAQLNDISVTLRDDKGREYEMNKNGVTGTYSEDGNLAAKWYESSYFTKTKSITAVVNGIDMIPTDKRYGMISLKNKTIENMPEGVSLKDMVLEKDGSLTITLNVQFEDNNWTSVMQWEYIGGDAACDEEDYIISSRGINSHGEKDNTVIMESEGNDGIISGYELEIGQNPEFDEEHNIPNYKDGDYRVEWLYARETKLDTPIYLKIK